MLTNPFSGKIIKNATNKKILFEIVNNYFPNKYKYLPTPPNITPASTRITLGASEAAAIFERAFSKAKDPTI